MIPVLYPATETAFTTNGLGGLPDAINCIITEQRNTQGGYYLEMDYPVDGLHYADIAPERIIYAAPFMGATPQPFRISRINRPINGIVHIEAPHISAQLQKITTSGTFTARSFTGVTYDFAEAARDFGQAFPFWFSSDKTFTETQISFPEPTPFANVLLGAEGSILDTFGGEYEFDGYHIILHSQRGTDSGLEIRYGVNMSDIEAETDASELVTAVIPFWKGTVNDADVVVIGDMCSADNASAYAYVRCVPLDVSQQFELEQDQQPTKAQVTAKGTAFINSTSRKLLQTSIKVKYEPTTSGIGERLINLCDTVRVVYPDLNVSSISKVVETKFNTLTEQYDELTIGSIRNNIVDTIAGLISGGTITGGGGSSGGSGGSSAVTSVNGKTGAVVLNAADVGAMPNTYTAPVQSVNSKTGAITLTAADVGALDEIADVIYDINAEFHADTADHYFTFASGVNASSILAALNEGKLPIVRNNYGSLKRKWFYADYNDDGNDIYIQFFRETQFSREVMLYTESDGKAYIDSVSLSSFKRKPVTVWEVADVSQGLIALNTNISSSLAWQLTNLNLSPFKRIKIYVKAGRKTGSLSADSSITPASIIEMSLDDRAKETVSQNAFIGSSVVQNPNDPNRLGLITCAVSGDKTKFAVLRATTLYGTAATNNTDAYPYVFLIEGYYD